MRGVRGLGFRRSARLRRRRVDWVATMAELADAAASPPLWWIGRRGIAVDPPASALVNVRRSPLHGLPSDGPITPEHCGQCRDAPPTPASRSGQGPAAEAGPEGVDNETRRSRAGPHRPPRVGSWCRPGPATSRRTCSAPFSSGRTSPRCTRATGSWPGTRRSCPRIGGHPAVLREPELPRHVCRVACSVSARAGDAVRARRGGRSGLHRAVGADVLGTRMSLASRSITSDVPRRPDPTVAHVDQHRISTMPRSIGCRGVRAAVDQRAFNP